MEGVLADEQRGRGRPPKADYLSPAKAAAWLTDRGYPISGQTIRRLCAADALEHTTTPGGFVRIRVDVVEKYLQQALYKRSTTA